MINDLLNLPCREAIGRFKYTLEDQLEERFEEVRKALANDITDALNKKEDLF